MGKIIVDGECICQVVLDISSNIYSFGISKGRKEAFPHIIIGSTRDGRTKWVSVRSGCVNGANLRFLNKNYVSSRSLKESMSQGTLLVHIN